MRYVSREEKSERIVRERILNEITLITNRLSQIETSFNLISDNDLIEAAIFEERSLKSRYAFLLRLAKEHKITCRIPAARKGRIS